MTMEFQLSRYQWYHEKNGEDERPIIINSDMALVHDLKDYMTVDENGNEGAVNCIFKDESKMSYDGSSAEEGYTPQRRLLNSRSKQVVHPAASHTI